jgi:uncharacterized protein (TIGR02118 family)
MSSGAEQERRLLTLLKRRAAVDPASFHQRLLSDAGTNFVPLEQVEFLALYAIDPEARAATSSRAPAAQFDAALEIVTTDAALIVTIMERSACASILQAYRVQQRHLKQRAPSQAPAARTVGVVMVAPVYRNPTLSPAHFEEHWAMRHAPLALRHHVGMWDYRQNVVREALSPSSASHDGIAMLGFPSVEAFKKGLYDSAEGREAIVADSQRFVDMTRVDSALFGEYVLKR